MAAVVKRALITGINGQDGHYLSRLLLGKGYEVVGLSRRASALPEMANLRRVDGDVTDRRLLDRLFDEWRFDEVYNLAGSSFGPKSWDDPMAACEVLGVAVVALLEILRKSGRGKLFQASSSELFGLTAVSPQNEITPFDPVSPYGAAKLLAHSAVAAYRREWGVFGCSGILFNHESPLRRPEFVTRKVTRAAAGIRLGLASELRLGNLAARRDWSFAGDVAEAMWRMLQADVADDFVIASGTSHTVRDLCEVAFSHAGLDYCQYVAEDPSLIRPMDFDRRGDPAKARRVLGWTPSVSFEELVRMMVDADLEEMTKSGC